MVFYIGPRIVLFPPTRQENLMIHSALFREYRRDLPHYWGIISPRWNVALVSPNKLLKNSYNISYYKWKKKKSEQTL